MSEHSYVSTRTLPDERPPAATVGLLGWMRQNLFSSIFSTILTIVILALAYVIIPPLLNWFIFESTVGAVPAENCRTEGGHGGACWAFLAEWWRFIVFGRVPPDLQWRPATVVIIIVGLLILSANMNNWKSWLVWPWIAGMTINFVLMTGGVLGLKEISQNQWGGLPLTLGLSVIGLGAAFPLGVFLALGRRSRMPVLKSISVIFIELIRGVPLITVLFMSTILFPLFLPEGITINTLLRAQIGMILFAAAYLAEVVRGGLQAIPSGQYEAADSLGLSYWKKMWLIILPQALKISIPPMVNTFIGFFKDTSLVVIIGLFDLVGAAKQSLTDPDWRAYYKEAYVFIALIYFAFCFSMSKYSQWLEKKTDTSLRGR